MRTSRRCRAEADRIVIEAAEFADASPEPELDSLYDHLYVVGDAVPGWYAVDERSPDPHPGEAERKAASERAEELRRARRRLRRARRGAARGGPRRATGPIEEAGGGD